MKISIFPVLLIFCNKRNTEMNFFCNIRLLVKEKKYSNMEFLLANILARLANIYDLTKMMLCKQKCCWLLKKTCFSNDVLTMAFFTNEFFNVSFSNVIYFKKLKRFVMPFLIKMKKWAFFEYFPRHMQDRTLTDVD